MDLFLLHTLALLWVTVVAVRHLPATPRARRGVAGLLIAAWLLLAAVWTGDVVRFASQPPTPPLLRPVQATEPPPALPPATSPAPAGLLFGPDLVASAEAAGWEVDGLLPAVGPLPDAKLPRLRGAPGPVVRIVIPAQPSLARLRVAFSARLHQRNRAGLIVSFNGSEVRRVRLGGATAWHDEVVELVPRAGDNVIEFHDAPLHDEPDWLDYLERYPDVRRYLVTHNLPLEAGAQAHYEAAGRPEGRTIRLIATLPPAADAYTFLFRQLRVEGFRQP